MSGEVSPDGPVERLFAGQEIRRKRMVLPGEQPLDGAVWGHLTAHDGTASARGHMRSRSASAHASAFSTASS